MSDLIQEFPGATLEEWRIWYTEKHPNAVENATKKVLQHVQNLSEAIVLIDEEMVRKWVEDIVINKTFAGLRFQSAIIKLLGKRMSVEYRLATPEEESRGIDGYLGTEAVSIKPSTYKAQRLQMPEVIDCKIIYYEKKKTGVKVECDL